MTLKQAFTNWSLEPKNIVLAANSRIAVQEVLMKKYSDIDLEQVTRTFALRLFAKSSKTRDIKVKAASILALLLNWGAEHGHCKHSTFTYTIVDEAEHQCLPEIEERVCLPSRPKEKELKPTNNTVMEEKKVSTKSQPVVQIDTNTLQPIKTWRSANEVTTALGIKNIGRAIERKGVAGGYHWCYAGDEANFKPREQQVSKPQQKQKDGRVLRPGKPVATVPVTSVAVNDVTLTMYSDQQLADELARRGFKGVMERLQTIKIGEYAL